MTKKPTTDAVAILEKHFGKTLRSKELLEEAQASAEIARTLYALRVEAGLTQAQLAEKVGTSRTVITRIEDDDYDGHSLSLLRRVAAALNRKIELRFVPADD